MSALLLLLTVAIAAPESGGTDATASEATEASPEHELPERYRQSVCDTLLAHGQDACEHDGDGKVRFDPSLFVEYLTEPVERLEPRWSIEGTEVLAQAPALPDSDPAATTRQVTCEMIIERRPDHRPVSLSRTLERVPGVSVHRGFPAYRGVPMELYIDSTWLPHRTAPRLAASAPRMPRGNIHYR